MCSKLSLGYVNLEMSRSSRTFKTRRYSREVIARIWHSCRMVRYIDAPLHVCQNWHAARAISEFSYKICWHKIWNTTARGVPCSRIGWGSFKLALLVITDVSRWMCSPLTTVHKCISHPWHGGTLITQRTNCARTHTTHTHESDGLHSCGQAYETLESGEECSRKQQTGLHKTRIVITL
jgi:hypothetical protein